MVKTIGNPISWSVRLAWSAGAHLVSSVGKLGSTGTASPPQVRRIEMADLWRVLTRGFEDFAAFRSDIVFLVVIYPIVGACLAWFALDGNLLPLLFPIVSGFALVGPVAAVGLYEMSRRREQGLQSSWLDAFAVVKSPSFGAIFVLGLFLFAIFVVWMVAAGWIYSATMGPEPPASVSAFARDTLTTGAGWAMIIVGMAVGFVFAIVVLAISVVSFPLLLDRDVGLPVAVITSVRVATTNPRPICAWGLIVAVALGLGSLPAFLGLIVVMPVLGHATWHLYRLAVR